MNPPADATPLPGLTLLHGGALGDLALSIQLCLSLKVGARASNSIALVSRVSLKGLHVARPAITWQSADSAGVTWLYRTDDTPASDALARLIRGAIVVNALSDAGGQLHTRLTRLGPRRLYSFDPRPRHLLGRHITAQWRDDLRSQGARFDSCIRRRGVCHVRLPLAGSACETGERIAAAPREAPLPVLIHPGGGGTHKCWPLESFEHVADQLTERRHPSAFRVGPVELERWQPGELDRIRRAHRLIESHTSESLVAALRRAALLLCNDSGPGHLAALLGIPVVSLFGPTLARHWRPLGERCASLQGDPAAGDDWGIKPVAVVRSVLDLLPPAAR